MLILNVNLLNLLFVPSELEIVRVIQKSTPERAGKHCYSTDHTRHIFVEVLAVTIY